LLHACGRELCEAFENCGPRHRDVPGAAVFSSRRELRSRVKILGLRCSFGGIKVLFSYFSFREQGCHVPSRNMFRSRVKILGLQCTLGGIKVLFAYFFFQEKVG
jgi:hypothetical protein